MTFSNFFKLLVMMFFVSMLPVLMTAQNLKIFTASDLHYFDPDLIINDGSALDAYLMMDRKMLRESEAILEALIEKILAEQPDIVLIPGDLTKDGELSSHQKLASYFQLLEDEGIEVFVIPGNHDINNPHAFAFDGSDMIPVSTVTPEEFSTIYANYGFNQAFAHDPHSLTYIVEPVPGLWIFGMDVCKYDDNYVLGRPETGGRFKTETLEWISERMLEGKNSNKRMIGMMHHGLTEHYQGQSVLFSEYVIEDWQTLSVSMADMGMKAVFTGHYHAQDIVGMTTPAGNTIYDIETGSMVTYPCPYRIVEITNNNNVAVTSGVIESIDYDLGGLDFQTYAFNYISTGLPILVNYILTNPPYNLDPATAALMTPVVTEAFIAHYAGNEGNPSPQSQAVINYLLSVPQYQMFGMMIMSIWNDPAPDDLEFEFAMAESFRLTILHNNDGESQLISLGNDLNEFGGVARFKSLADSLKSDAEFQNSAVLMLSSGDNFLAGPEFNASLSLPEGQPYYDAIGMDYVGYDAICIGNHDFDFGPDVLAKFIHSFSITQPTFLSANLDFSAEDTLQNLVNAGRIAASVTIDKLGEEIAVIGLTTPKLPYISSPRNVTVDEDIVNVVQNQVDALEMNGVNKIILISHLQSILEDLDLASKIHGIDVMIAGGGDELLANPGDILIPGHENLLFGSYPLEVNDLNDEVVYVITGPGEYAYLGQLIIDFDQTGKVINYAKAAALPGSGPKRVASESYPDGVPSNTDLLNLVVEPVNQYIDGLSQNIIAVTEVTLDGLRTSVRRLETNEGDLVADALLWQASQLAPVYGVKTPQVALQNSGGIRNNSLIHAGSTISELNTFDILPFSNFVCVIEDVPAEKFKEILENAVSRVEFTDGRYAQVAGLEFTWDPAGISQIITNGVITTPGTRIIEAKLANGAMIIENGMVLPDAPAINVATIDFLAKGGDQYPYGELEFTTLGVTYQQALFNYISNARNALITAEDYPEGGNARILNLNQQNINVPMGWSIISGYIDPANSDLSQVLKKIVTPGNLEILIGFNGIFWPGQNINTFTNGWDYVSGYKTKMNAGDYFVMNGSRVENSEILLSAGANYLPVPVSYPVEANAVFASIENQLVFAYDLSTMQVYWPAGGIFTLEYLTPGKGYLILMSAEATVSFAELKSFNTGQDKLVMKSQFATPWQIQETGVNHLIAINTEAIQVLENGDVLAVFNQEGIFAGQAEIAKNEGNILLVAYGDDNTTNLTEGLEEGDEFVFKLYRSTSQEMLDVNVEYNHQMPNTGFFAENGATMITKISLGVGSTEEINSNDKISVHPNPSTGYFTIATDLSSASRMVIVNTLGQEVFEKHISDDQTNQTFTVDISSHPRGIYFIKVFNGTKTLVQKVIIE